MATITGRFQRRIPIESSKPLDPLVPRETPRSYQMGPLLRRCDSHPPLGPWSPGSTWTPTRSQLGDRADLAGGVPSIALIPYILVECGCCFVTIASDASS